MIYVEQDFYSNFTASVTGKDSEQQRDILMTEIAQVIVNDRDQVIQLLNTVGTKMNNAAIDKQLVNACVKQASNPKFQKGMAYLIARRNELMDGEKKSGSIDPISGIAQAIGDVFSSGAQKTVAEKQNQSIEDTNRTALLMKVLELKGGAPPKSNTGKYVLIGILGLAAIVAAVLIFKKKK